jgi:type II secretory pathway component PulC
MRVRIWILNLLLLAMAAGLVWKLKTDWHTYAAANGPQALVLRPLGSVVAPPSSPQGEYSAIARQNAFHPDRNDSMPPPPAVQVTTAPPPLVYGSLIMGDNRYALMAPDESGVPQQILEGQSLNGYKLVRVQAQSVTLESSSGQQEIMFYNAMSKLRRNSSKTVATSTGASGGAVRTGSAPTTSAPAASAASTSSTAPQQTAAPAAAEAPPGKKVVQTPFGPMLMDDKPAQPVIKQ